VPLLVEGVDPLSVQDGLGTTAADFGGRRAQAVLADEPSRFMLLEPTREEGLALDAIEAGFVVLLAERGEPLGAERFVTGGTRFEHRRRIETALTIRQAFLFDITFIEIFVAVVTFEALGMPSLAYCVDAFALHQHIAATAFLIGRKRDGIEALVAKRGVLEIHELCAQFL